MRAAEGVAGKDSGSAGRVDGRGGAGIREAADGGEVRGRVRIAGFGGLFREERAEDAGAGERAASQPGGEGENGKIDLRTAGRGGNYQFVELPVGDSHESDYRGGGGRERGDVQGERCYAGVRGVDWAGVSQSGISTGPGDDSARRGRRGAGAD